MNQLILFASAGAEGAGPIGRIAESFGVNWPHFFAQVISFSVVAFLLHRFAYRPILRVLEERKQQIAETLANNEKIKAELAKTEEARKEILQKANQQANQLIAEARSAAARVQEAETQNAIAAAEQILAKAREAAQADQIRMMTELKRELGRLVVETTARVAGKVLTADDQQRLAEDANQQLAVR